MVDQWVHMMVAQSAAHSVDRKAVPLAAEMVEKKVVHSVGL